MKGKKIKYDVTLVKDALVRKGTIELSTGIGPFVKTCASYGWILTESNEVGGQKVDCKK